jgi:short-subunit dehydrogenase
VHIVVTGASSGIGRDLARAFDAPDNKVSLVARRRKLLEELQAEMKSETHVVEADLSSAADPVGWLVRAEARFGPTDVLINNAGISYVEAVQGVDDERARAIFQINVHTPIAAMQRVLPPMIERGRGTIVNVISAAAFSPAPYFCHYTATKAALGGFSESLRMELRRTGVHVVSVYPGPIHTETGERNFDQFKGEMARRTPTGDTQTLAAMVVRAVKRRKPRVIYPRFFLLGWWWPALNRWGAERFVPEPTGKKTPALPGDGAR